MKIFMSLLVVIFLTLSSVFASGNLDVISEVNPPAGNPEATVTGSFQVKNLDAVNQLAGMVFVPSELDHATDLNSKIPTSSLSFNPASISTLAAGATSPAVASNVLIPKLSKPGSYTGNVEVKESTNASNSDTFALTVIVNPFPKVAVTSFTTTTPLVIKEEQGEIAEGTFELKNEGNVVLSNLAITNNVVLADNDGDVIVLTFTGLP